MRASTVLLALIAVLLAGGCMSWPTMGQMTFATTDTTAVRVEVLQKGVLGRWCVTRSLLDTLVPARLGRLFVDYSLAVEIAIRQVPGADILTDVVIEEEFRQYGLWSVKCARVRGNAARVL